MTLLRNLSWYEARHYARLGSRIRRDAWPAQVSSGVTRWRWFRRVRNLWHVEDYDGALSVVEAMDSTAENFTARDWIAEVDETSLPPAPPAPEVPPYVDPAPETPGQRCDNLCLFIGDRPTGGAGDPHFVVGGSRSPLGMQATVAFDDNVDSGGRRTLWLGSRGAQVWFRTKDYPAIANTTAIFEIGAWSPEWSVPVVLRASNELDGGFTIYSEEEPAAFTDPQLNVSVPIPGSTAAIALSVACRVQSGYCYLDFGCDFDRMTWCQAREMSGVLGAVYAGMVAWFVGGRFSEPYATVLRESTGSGMDGIGRLAAFVQMTRASFEDETVDPAVPMGAPSRSWPVDQNFLARLCTILNFGLIQQVADFPDDPLWNLDAVPNPGGGYS